MKSTDLMADVIVGLLIEGRNRKMERKTARKVMCHGTHGSKPLFEGDCWTMSCVCEACGEHVDPYASECEHCGAIFEGEVNDDEID